MHGNLNEVVMGELCAIRDEVQHLKDKLDTPTYQSLKAEWLNGEQAQEILSIRPRTLAKYREDRVIGYSQVGAKLYYRASDLQAHLENHYVPSQLSRT